MRVWIFTPRLDDFFVEQTSDFTLRVHEKDVAVGFLIFVAGFGGNRLLRTILEKDNQALFSHRRQSTSRSGT